MPSNKINSSGMLRTKKCRHCLHRTGELKINERKFWFPSHFLCLFKTIRNDTPHYCPFVHFTFTLFSAGQDNCHLFRTSRVASIGQYSQGDNGGYFSNNAELVNGRVSGPGLNACQRHNQLDKQNAFHKERCPHLERENWKGSG